MSLLVRNFNIDSFLTLNSEVYTHISHFDFDIPGKTLTLRCTSEIHFIKTLIYFKESLYDVEFEDSVEFLKN